MHRATDWREPTCCSVFSSVPGGAPPTKSLFSGLGELKPGSAPSGASPASCMMSRFFFCADAVSDGQPEQGSAAARGGRQCRRSGLGERFWGWCQIQSQQHLAQSSAPPGPGRRLAAFGRYDTRVRVCHRAARGPWEIVGKARTHLARGSGLGRSAVGAPGGRLLACLSASLIHVTDQSSPRKR